MRAPRRRGDESRPTKQGFDEADFRRLCGIKGRDLATGLQALAHAAHNDGRPDAGRTLAELAASLLLDQPTPNEGVPAPSDVLFFDLGAGRALLRWSSGRVRLIDVGTRNIPADLSASTTGASGLYDGLQLSG